MSALVSAESVAIGHPDKVADQISDAILDAYLEQDPDARVDCTCVLSHNTLLLAGEITSSANVDVVAIAKSVLSDIGYSATWKVVLEITQQSADIANAVIHTGILGAGDQGIMIGYATDETDEYMPLPVVIAHKLMQALWEERPLLGPDGKALVSVRYKDNQPDKIETIVLSCQHTAELSLDEVRQRISTLIIKHTPSDLCTATTELLLNPGGRFVVAGPSADTGLTGRKLMVDCYGTSAHHGGGAFSGKDPTKVDRSASYMARYIAKNIVAAKIAKRAEVALCYVIGNPYPIGLSVNTFGTSKTSHLQLEQAIPKIFDLSISGIISHLQLQRPIYRKTAWGGHFGRCDPLFTWEATDKIQQLLSVL